MQSQTKTNEITLISIFIAMSLVLSYVESFIPIRLLFAMPGIKLGLANVISLVAITLLEYKKIYLMVIVRIIMAAIFIGSFMSFWYSLAGGLLSLTAMLVLYKIFGNGISIVGVSAIGGIFHNIGQIIVLTIITRNVTIALTVAPKLMVAGLVSGIFMGFVALYIRPYVKKAY